ncbi:MAG: ferric iron uptake transcriptional regulator [Proteobacteria bacterium]|nr:ferric iron uptake transcriptional regulator [Pseudomonadota bacterium]
MEELKKFGLKATLPRLRILQLLETNHQHHMSAEDIYKTLLDVGEDISLATVYRVLTQFEAAGLVIRHRFDDNSFVFELDAGYHHDHLLCIKCGKVIEFVDNVIEEHQRTIAKQHGFKITDHCLHIYGICSTCYDTEKVV